MPKVEPTSKTSTYDIKDFNELSRQLDLIYEKLANGINTKSDTVVSDDTAPATTDTDFDIGDKWIKRDTNQVYVLTDKAVTGTPAVLTATWTEVS